VAEGIQILVKQVALFTPEFEAKLAALRSDDARASEMEHALRHEIDARLEEDPAFYASLRERLEKIVADGKAKRIDAAKQLQLTAALAGEAHGRAAAAEALGLSETGMALYGVLAEPRPLTAAEPKGPAYGKVDEASKELASLIEEQLAPQVALVDWAQKDDVQREMRRIVKRQLRAARYAPEKVDATAERVVDLLKRRRRG
jgi:type I restriction enzyme R subunit